MTHRFCIVWGAVLALSGSVLAQSAAPLPRQGTVEHKLCFSGQATQLVATETDTYGTYSVSGVTQSDNKAFDALSMECVAAYEMRSKVWQHRGYCVFQDASGDRYHGADNWTTDGGYRFTYLGGTGKFKGMSGEGIGDKGGQVKPIRPGTLQGCRVFKTTYTLP